MAPSHVQSQPTNPEAVKLSAEPKKTEGDFQPLPESTSHLTMSQCAWCNSGMGQAGKSHTQTDASLLKESELQIPEW